MCWNPLSVVLCSVVFCALFDFGPSRVLADEPSYEGNKTVREGDPFKITCRMSKFQVLKWQKDGRTLGTDEHYKISEEESTENIVSTISVNSASSMHSGAYRCTTQYDKFHVLQVVTAQLKIKTNYDFSGNDKVGEYKSRLVLQCDIENPQQGSTYSWKWFKGNNHLLSDSEDPHHIDVNENTLKINRFIEDDGGKYTCKLFNANDKTELLQKDFNVILKPYLKLPKTATYIEGEKVELECIVHAYPLSELEISWKFENTTIKATDEKYKFLSNKNNVSNAILVFNPITMAHRGEYVCSVKWKASLIESNVIYVRIKDKMAALWPFLGICAEVVILCLIIFIYEKKRNKAEFEESDTDQGPETNNANDHSGGDVRHRK